MEIKEILLVDEEAPIISAVSFILQCKGYLVMLAPDARTAWEDVENYHFDLILFSLSGYEVDKLDLLQRAKRKSPQPKVMVVGNPLKTTWPLEILNLEVDDYLLTPFTAPELCFRVDRCLRSGRDIALNVHAREKGDTINERVLNSLRFKILYIHNTIFSLASHINIFINQNNNYLYDYNNGKIKEISNDLVKIINITEELLYNFLICSNDSDLNQTEGIFINYNH